MSQTPQQPERKDERKESAPSKRESAPGFFGVFGLDLIEGLFKGIGWLFRNIFGLIFNIIKFFFKSIFELFD